MTRRGRIVLWSVFGGCAVGALVVLQGYRLSEREPEWYLVPRDLDAIDRAARRAEDKLLETRNWAAALAAAELRAFRSSNARLGQAGQSASGVPGNSQSAALASESKPLEVTLSAEELSALLMKWTKLQGWENSYKNYLEDPVVAVHEGRIVLAGRVKELGTVLSLHFRPELTEADPGTGGATIRFVLERVTGGRLPLPVSLARGQLERVRSPLGDGLLRWKADAMLDSRGQGNTALTLCAAGGLAMAAITGEPVEAVAFVPVDDRRSTPVYVTEMVVVDGGLRIGARPIPRGERAAVVTRLRK